MLGWVGDILYWLGCGIAVLFLAAGVASLVWGEGDRTVTMMFGFMMAVLSWLAGWALRYALTGRR
jgi:hypothetical protein